MEENTLVEPVVEAASAASSVAQPLTQVLTQAANTVVTVPDAAAVATTVVTPAGVALTPNAFIVTILGQQVNLLSVLIVGIILGLLVMFFRIQVSKKLDFTDIITFDGRKVSLTKVMQLLGGLAATWIVLKMAAVGTLSSELFGIYLLFIAGIEGYAKYVSAKYGYSETSVKDGGGVKTMSDEQTTLQSVVDSALDAENSARDAKVTARTAAADLTTKD